MPITPTNYNFDAEFTNLTNSSLNLINMSVVAATPYTGVFGSIFWGLFFGSIFFVMWIRMEDITIPSLLGLLIGGSLWASLPQTWVSMAMSLTVISFAGLVYSIIKARS